MHVPERMCIACRKMKPKSELVKVVKTEGGAELDISGKKFGRGAYICKNEECALAAGKRRLLSKHFKKQLGDEIYEEILEAAKNG